MAIVVTVPNAKAEKSVLLFSKHLVSAFEKHNLSYSIFYGDSYPSIQNLSTIEGKGSEYNELVLSKTNTDTIHFDLHAFSSEVESPIYREWEAEVILGKLTKITDGAFLDALYELWADFFHVRAKRLTYAQNYLPTLTKFTMNAEVVQPIYVREDISTSSYTAAAEALAIYLELIYGDQSKRGDYSEESI